MGEIQKFYQKELCSSVAKVTSEKGWVLSSLSCNQRQAFLCPPSCRASAATCSGSMTLRWWMPPCTGMLPASSTIHVSPTATLGSSTSMGRSTLSSLPCARSIEGRNSLTTINSPVRMPATSSPATVVPRNAGSS